MKSILALTLILSASAFASDACYRKAASSIYRQVRPNNPNWRVESVDCALAPNGRVVICELAGSNGDGAGDKSFQVVLNKECTRVLRLTLTGEE